MLSYIEFSFLGLYIFAVHEFQWVFMNAPYLFFRKFGYYEDKLIQPKKFFTFEEQMAALPGALGYHLAMFLPLLIIIGTIRPFAEIFTFSSSLSNPDSMFSELSLAVKIAQVTIFYLVVQIVFYIMHRTFHYPALYKFHKVHHEYQTPFGMVCEYAHPLETIFAFFFPALAGFVAAYLLGPIDFFSYFFMQLSTLIYTVEDHCGYEGLWWHLHGSKHHDIHHAKFNCNYGSRWMDVMLGTDYESKKAELKGKQS